MELNEVNEDNRQNDNLNRNSKKRDDESDNGRDYDDHHHHYHHGVDVDVDVDNNKVLKDIKNIIASSISLRLKHEHIILLQQLFDVGYDLCIVEVELIRICEVLMIMKPWIAVMESYVTDGVIHTSMDGVALYYRYQLMMMIYPYISL